LFNIKKFHHFQLTSNKNLSKRNYHIVNLIFTAIISFVFVYSAIFSPDKNNYPVICFHEKITGEPCSSCGLSHSFSEIVQGNIENARHYNKNGILIFSFFLIQFFGRIIASTLIKWNLISLKVLVIFDSTFSFLLFLFCFKNLFVFW